MSKTMRIIHIAGKDLLQVMRDRKSLLFLLIMPLVFTVFLGIIVGRPASDERIAIGIVNHGKTGMFDREVLAAFSSSPTFRPVSYSGQESEDIEELVAEGALVAALIVPEAYDTLELEAETVPLQIVAPSDSLSAHMAVTALKAVCKRLLGAVQSARIAISFGESKGIFESNSSRSASFEDALRLAQSGWEQPAVSVEMVAGVRPDHEGVRILSGFAQTSPGMIVQFAILGLLFSAGLLVTERKSGTLARMLTTATPRAAIIAGHLLSMAAVTFLQQLILIAVGQFALGVDYLAAPPGVLLMMVVVSLWAASAGMLIGVISSSQERVMMWSMAAMFVFTALGGAWFPLEVAGAAFRNVGRFTPGAWIMDGYQNIVVRGLDSRSVLVPAAVILAYAAGFFALAVWRYRAPRRSSGVSP